MKKLSLFFALQLMISCAMFAQVGISSDSSTPDPSAILDLKSTSKGVLVPRMSQDERNGILMPATGLMIYQTDQTAGFYYFNGITWIGIVTSAHYIGELFGGGIVFWIDNTGQHGLIVSLINMSTNAIWSDVSSTLIGPSAQSTWDGQNNSIAIMGQIGHTFSAAKLCDDYANADYGNGIFADWYLPSVDQLSLIYQNRYILNKNIESVLGTNLLSNNLYWSSTEISFNYAYYFHFRTSEVNTTNKGLSYWVRAIRSF